MTEPIGPRPFPAGTAGGETVGRGSRGTPAEATPQTGTSEPGASGERPAFRVEAYPRSGSAPADSASAGVAPDAPPVGAGEAARLQWAAEQLESLFIHELWKSMRRTVDKSGMFDGPGVRLFEEMLDEERARAMAEAGGLGLARLVYEQMSSYIVDKPVDEVGRTTPRRMEHMEDTEIPSE